MDPLVQRKVTFANPGHRFRAMWFNGSFEEDPGKRGAMLRFIDCNDSRPWRFRHSRIPFQNNNVDNVPAGQKGKSHYAFQFRLCSLPSSQQTIKLTSESKKRKKVRIAASIDLSFDNKQRKRLLLQKVCGCRAEVEVECASCS